MSPLFFAEYSWIQANFAPNKSKLKADFIYKDFSRLPSFFKHLQTLFNGKFILKLFIWTLKYKNSEEETLGKNWKMIYQHQ